MFCRNILVCLFIGLWGLVEWCRNEAQVIHEEVQRLCGSLFFSRCDSLPEPSPSAWIRLPGVYPVWDMLRRHQQLEWVEGNLEDMSKIDWLLQGVAGFLSFLLVVQLSHLCRLILVMLKNILRERTLDQIFALRRPSTNLLHFPTNVAVTQHTELSSPS